MDIHFCDQCDRRVTERELRRGKALQRGHVIICGDCLASGVGTSILERASIEAAVNADDTVLLRAGERREDIDDLYEVDIPADDFTPTGSPTIGRRVNDPAAALSAAASGFGALLGQQSALERKSGRESPAEGSAVTLGQPDSSPSDAPSDTDEPVQSDAETVALPSPVAEDEGADVAQARGATSQRKSGRMASGGRSSGKRSDSRSRSSNGRGSDPRASRGGNGRNSDPRASRGGGKRPPPSRSGRSPAERDDRRGSSSRRRPAKKNNNLVIAISCVSLGIILAITLAVMFSKQADRPPAEAAGPGALNTQNLEVQISGALSQAAKIHEGSSSLAEIQAALDRISNVQQAYYQFVEQNKGRQQEIAAWTESTRFRDMQAQIRRLNDAKAALSH